MKYTVYRRETNVRQLIKVRGSNYPMEGMSPGSWKSKHISSSTRSLKNSINSIHRITPYITVHIPLTATTTPIATIPTNSPPTNVLAPFFFVPPPLDVVPIELLPDALAGAVGKRRAKAGYTRRRDASGGDGGGRMRVNSSVACETARLYITILRLT